MQLTPERKKKRFGTAFFLLYLWICCELTSLVLFYAPFIPSWLSTRVQIGNDTSWRIQWAKRRLWAADRSGSAMFVFDVYDATKGWKLKPGLRDAKVFGGKRLSSNSKGIRGAQEIDYAKNGRFRILLLGDSFTFGEEVSDEETYAARLQQLLGDRYEIVNMGVHGYGHDQMLLYYVEEGRRYQADLVLLGFCEVDMSRNTVAFRDYAKPKFELRNGELVQTVRTVPPVEGMMVRAFVRSHALDFAGMLLHRLRLILFRRNEFRERERVTEALLDRMIEEVERDGATFAIVYLPNWPSTSGKRFIRSFIERNSVPYFDPSETLKRVPDASRFMSGGHYSPETNRELALFLQRSLIRANLVTS